MKDLLISEFCNEQFQSAFKRYFDELGVNVTDWDNLFIKMTEDKDNLAYIRLTNDDKIIGFIQFNSIRLSNWFFETSYGFVREFWIDTEYRGKGNAEELLNLVEAHFLSNGIFKSILTTETSPRFFEKCGYVKDPTIHAKNNDDVFVKLLK